MKKDSIMTPSESAHFYALIDCNNFYCSCERLFQPKYQNVGVAVLSNNDGCIVSRSAEVKELGVPMGAPYFQYRALMHRHRVAVFSSNFPLYGDISMRIQQLMRHFYCDVEVYSIDECFLKLSRDSCKDPCVEMQRLRGIIWQWVGIPVSIGIASSKTLAKLANVAAKKTVSGVLDASDPKIHAYLMSLPVGEVWGIGRRWQKKLNRYGIETVAQLRAQPSTWLRQHFSIVGVRIVQELHGVACSDIQEWHPKKSVLVSRSFAGPVQDFATLNAALAQYIVRAAEKARAQKSLAGVMQVFVHQVPQRKTDQIKRYHTLAQTTTMNAPCSDPQQLLALGTRLLRGLYRAGRAYHKIGVSLYQLRPIDGIQGDLFHEVCTPKRQRLLESVDRINQKMGSGTLRFATEKTGQKIPNRCENLSAHYTTRWQDIPRASCG